LTSIFADAPIGPSVAMTGSTENAGTAAESDGCNSGFPVRFVTSISSLTGSPGSRSRDEKSAAIRTPPTSRTTSGSSVNT
jgi:hypothetical protein